MLYFAIARSAVRRAVVYRSAFLAAMLTNAFFGVIISYSFIGAYGTRSEMAGLSLSDTLTYIWAGQALISLGLGWIIHPEIGEAVRNGDIVSDLCRPWSFLGYWMARSFGERSFNLAVRVPLTYAFGVVLFGARLPLISDLPLILLSLLGSMLISFCVSFAVQLSAFWLIDNSGVNLLVTSLILLFSGFLMPLAFFPEWMLVIANLLPFRAMTDIPLRIFVGTLSGHEALNSLGQQWLWIALLLPSAGLLVRAALRKLEIQGG